MGTKERGWLTEPMFYVLMAFQHRERCGIEIAEFIQHRTAGRLSLGPGTLYTLLGKFQEEGLIREIRVEGRKRTYAITEKGLTAYREEVDRLRVCLADAEREEEFS